LREGYAAERVYVICRGGDQAHYGFGGGEIVAGAGGGPGDVLGLASLLKGSQHKLSAVAIELSDVQSVRRAKFLGFMERHRDMSMNTALAGRWRWSMRGDAECAAAGAFRLCGGESWRVLCWSGDGWGMERRRRGWSLRCR